MQKLLYGIAGLFVLLVCVGLFLPRFATVTIAVTIDAPGATVFAQVDDYRRLALWSPLLDSDPNARLVHSGPARGVGATMTWDGGVIGSGLQTITESLRYSTVTHTMHPGELGETTMRFEIDSVAPGQSVVTWRYEHDYGLNVLGRFFGLYFKGIVRRDYEVGLRRLKDLSESLPSADFGALNIEHIAVEAADIAYLPTTAAPEAGAISDSMGAAFFEILSFIDRHGLTEAGAPMSITRSFSGTEILFDAAIPVRGLGVAPPSDGTAVRIGETYEGNVIRVRHRGSYRTLAATHAKISAYLAAYGIERTGDAWESYVSDPTRVPEAELTTDVYYPVGP